MSICLFVCLSVRLFVRLFVCPFVYLFVCPFVCSFVCPFVRSFVCLSVCLFVCLSACLFVRVLTNLYLLNYFYRVIKHSSENRMSANSLAIVFGPTLMWTQRNSNIGTMFVLQGQVTENFIEDFDVLFLNTSHT